MTNSAGNITFTVPTGQFFKGKVGGSWSVASIGPESHIGMRIRNNNSSGSIVFADSRIVSGYQGANLTGTHEIGFATDVVLGAGTYFLEQITVSAGPNPILSIGVQRYFVSGELYYNTP
jgi:hypothetical protein